jgi:hypothetical protein
MLFKPLLFLGAATPPVASALLNCSTSDCSLQVLSQVTSNPAPETAWGLVVFDPDAPKTLAVVTVCQANLSPVRFDLDDVARE